MADGVTIKMQSPCQALESEITLCPPPATMAQVMHLPDSILLDIFRYLPFNSICRASQVCSRWNSVAGDELLWRNVFLSHYKLPLNTALPPRADSWQLEFKRLFYHTPCQLVEERQEHKDEVLHVSFSNNGTMFATCSKDGFFKIWSMEHSPVRLLFKMDMKSQFSWQLTQFSQFNATDTCLLVSGVYLGRYTTSGEIAVFNLEDDFKIQCRVTNKPYDVFGAWYDKDHLLSGTHYIRGGLSSVSAIWISRASQEVESSMESVSMVLYRFHNRNFSSVRLIHVAEVTSSTETDGSSPDQHGNVAEGKTGASGGSHSSSDSVCWEPSLLDQLLCKEISEEEFDIDNEDWEVLRQGEDTEEEDHEDDVSVRDEDLDVDRAELHGCNKDEIGQSSEADIRHSDISNNAVESECGSHSYSTVASPLEHLSGMRDENEVLSGTDSNSYPSLVDAVPSSQSFVSSSLSPESWAVANNSVSRADILLAGSSKILTVTAECQSEMYEDAHDKQSRMDFCDSVPQEEPRSGTAINTRPVNDEDKPMQEDTHDEKNPPYLSASPNKSLVGGSPHSQISSLSSVTPNAAASASCAAPSPLSLSSPHCPLLHHSPKEGLKRDGNDIIKNRDTVSITSFGACNSAAQPFVAESGQQSQLSRPPISSTQSSSSSSSSLPLSSSGTATSPSSKDSETCSRVATEPYEINYEPLPSLSPFVPSKVSGNPHHCPPFSPQTSPPAPGASSPDNHVPGSSQQPETQQQEVSQQQQHAVAGCSRQKCTGRKKQRHQPQYRIPPEKLLIFAFGTKTYTPHMVGIKTMKWADFSKGEETARRSSMLPCVMESLQNSAEPSRRDEPDHSFEMHGHIVGLRVAPDQRYLYINCRPWPKGYIISDPQESPPIAQEVEITTLDLQTLEFVGPVLRSHKAFTHSDDCFFLNVDVSEHYVVSGAEDKHGYLWDRHYGIPLYRFQHNSVVNCVAVNPRDPEVLVTVSDDYSIKVWTSRHKMQAKQEGASRFRTDDDAKEM